MRKVKSRKWFIGIVALSISSSLILTCGQEEKPKEKEETGIGMLVSPDEPDKIVEDSEGYNIASNKVVISFKEGVSKDEINSIISSIGGKITGDIPQIGYYEVTVPISTPTSAAEIESIISQLLINFIVKTVEKYYVCEPDTLDIENTELDVWGYERVQLAEAYQAIGDKKLNSVKVAVIDSGFDLNHFDLDENFTQARYDFADNDSDVSPPSDPKLYNHGTEVSGIVAAENGNNDQAISTIKNLNWYFNGLATHARIIPLKIFSNYWGGEALSPLCFNFKLGQAITYAVNNNANVINMSVGSKTPIGLDYLIDAISYAHNKGVTMVASAGNKEQDASNHYPSAFNDVISVGGTNKDDIRTSFSNYSANDNIAILSLAAPGLDIATTIPSNFYDKASGTSVAAPIVSGLAALLKSLDNSLSPSQLEQIMRNTADDIIVTYPDGPTTHVWKRINALNAVKYTIDNICVPTTEICDGVDNDCDGLVDEGGVCGATCTPGTVVASFPSPGTSPTGLAWDGTYLWNGDGGTETIYKLTTSGAVVDSFPSPGPCPEGLAWDGTYLWNADICIPETIYKLDTSGTVLDSFPFRASGLAWDGTYLLSTEQLGNTIYKLDTSGTVVDSFPSPDECPTGLAWDGTYLWNADACIKPETIYKLNTSGGVVDSFGSPDASPQGLAWDGTYLWNAGKATDTIYKLNTECP